MNPSDRTRLGCLTTAALAFSALVPAMASASIAELRFDQTINLGSKDGIHDYYALIVRADPGEVNRIVIERASGSELVVDRGAPLRAGNNCTAIVGGVSCTPPTPDALLGDVRIELGDGDDILDADFTATRISGGPGDDRLRATGGSPLFDGGPGADLMELQGSTGGAKVTYQDRTTPVNVSVDGVANDGEAGEGDDVRGLFGDVTGGEGADTLAASSPYYASIDGRAGNDRLIGGDRTDWLRGGPGDDVVVGGGEEDALYGDAGADLLSGGAGDDLLDGGAGVDLLSGGPGEDRVSYGERTTPVSVTPDDQPDDGEAGEGDDVRADVENVSGGKAGDVIVGSAVDNKLGGGDGDDVLIGREGADILDGGSGADVLEGGPGADLFGVDLEDRVKARDGGRDQIQCRSRSLPPTRLRADPIDVLRHCYPVIDVAVDLLGRTLVRVSRRGTITLALRCRGPLTSPPCQGIVTIRPSRRKDVWAKNSVRLRVQETRRVTLSLRPQGRRALAGRRDLFVRAVTTSRPLVEGPRATPLVRWLVLRPPARR